MTVAGGTADPAGVLGLVGLARRAGSLAAGVPATREALRGGRARLVLTAGDAAPGQVIKVEKVLGPVPRRVLGSRASLGEALGMAPVTAVAVTDRGMAEAILRRLDEPGSAGRSGMSG
jgi:ribosomal protein L7Ae-like RNA K-turn-binding protein